MGFYRDNEQKYIHRTTEEQVCRDAEYKKAFPTWGEQQKLKKSKESVIYLMNAAVMPAGCYGTYSYTPATVDDLAAVLNGKHGPMRSCIGYPQNADLIEGWTGIRPEISRVETRFEDGDRALVMRLTRRVVDPGTKGAPVSSDPADWEFAWVSFSA